MIIGHTSTPLAGNEDFYFWIVDQHSNSKTLPDDLKMVWQNLEGAKFSENLFKLFQWVEDPADKSRQSFYTWIKKLIKWYEWLTHHSHRTWEPKKGPKAQNKPPTQAPKAQ